uniref:Uncharacterized protein n=1 Tax=Rousettus aegyptiacus TaxID=9407 RepID=A0A7J8KAR6_ROUAE|nr:hypothetical protein HJG63_007826 [Rousettus aegyptiacus]
MVPGRHRLPRCSQAEATSTAPTRATWPLETQGTKTKLQIGPKGPDVNKSHFLPSTSPHFHGDSWSDSHSSRTLKGREDFHTERPGTGQRHSDQGAVLKTSLSQILTKPLLYIKFSDLPNAGLFHDLYLLPVFKTRTICLQSQLSLQRIKLYLNQP